MSQTPMTGRVKTPGEQLEGVAFTFCKCATVALLLGPFVLPGAAYLAALFYVLAYWKKKRDTRCVLRYPLLIAAFWAVVGTGSLWLKLDPGLATSIAGRLGLPWPR